MPLYEYECDACGHHFEVIVKFSDAPIETCPKCGGHVHKLMSSPAFHLKGTGWYLTDYARKGGESGGKDKSGESSSSNEKDGGKDTKSPSTSDAKKESTSESAPTSTDASSSATKSSTESKGDASSSSSKKD